MSINILQLPNPELASFYKKYPDFNILDFDFHNKERVAKLHSQLKSSGMAKGDIVNKVENLKSTQRLLNIHPDPQLASSLIDNGVVSANHLARIPRKDFITQYTRPLGLADMEAEKIHQRAAGIRNRSLQLWASVRGTVGSAYYRNSSFDTVSDQVKETFQGLPSYQDLFGSLDYCGCKECRSIFGAAAYLVDLLRIIDEYVTKPNLATITAISPDLLFTARRPDIGGIQLTCATTNDLVPYVQIVIERLLASAQQSLGQPSPEKVTEMMATTLVYPQALPFNAPLDQVRVLLEKAGVSFGAILSAWKSSPLTVAARSLGLSPEQQTTVTTPLTTAAQIEPYYNVTDISILSDANTFVAKTWMGFAGLLTLLNQDLSQSEQAAGLQVNFFLNQGLPTGKWVQLADNKTTDKQVLANLGLGQLDQINRLLRLASILGQPAQDIDWALRCLQAGSTPVITPQVLTDLYQLLLSATSVQLELTGATVLVGPIKTYGQGTGGTGSAFDLLFNPSGLISQLDSYHPKPNLLNLSYQDDPISWIPASTKTEDTIAINRVLPGLGLALSDVNALGYFLYGNANPLLLTVDVLSVLYRHALLSRALQLPMPRYLLFLGLMKFNDPTSPKVSEIGAMVSVGQWMIKTGVSVYQLDYIINGNPSVYINPLYQFDSVNDWLRGIWTIISDSSDTVGNDIIVQVAVLFGVNGVLMNTVMTMALAAVPLPEGAPTWENAFLTPDADGVTPKYGVYVQAVLKWVSRWLILSQSLHIMDAEMANVGGYPVAYQLPPTFNSIPLAAIQAIQQIRQMMQDNGDLQQNLLVFIALNTTGKPIDDQLEVLQKATSWNKDEVAELLLGPLKGSTQVMSLLTDLQNCFTLMGSLGSNPAFMASINDLGDLPAAGKWQQYLQSAADVMAKTASRYGNQWASIWTTLSGNIDLHMRDALLALVLSELNTKYPDGIKTDRNVYEFLLTDVEIGGPTSISYIKEALNAAQTYLQRCRLRLEAGVEDMTQIQDAWWQWMMNYRVWEANREIFVYPENYLIPNLQKNTTAQFEALSQALQQSDVNKVYVGTAFSAYINGFSEVAQLKPVDAYRTLINDIDTIFLLSRTKTGPYTFYYCSQQESMPWTAWEKIDLSINSPNCTIVYAFNRPFIFWNEIKKNNTSAVSGDAGTVKTNNSVTYSASVMYSFLNQEGKWVQPQTLVDDDTILFQADDARKVTLMDELIFQGLFDITSLYWNKTYAFSISANNYATPPPFKAEAERLVVVYGPNLLNTGTQEDQGTIPPSTDPNAAEFWANLHERVEDHNRLVVGQLSGNINLQPVAILNMSLEADVLVQRKELILIDPYNAGAPLSVINAVMQSSGDVMQLSHSGQPITDNHSAMNITSLNAGSVSTQVNGNSFISAGITPPQSLSVYQALQSASILVNGMVQTTAMATLDLFAVLGPMSSFNSFGPAQYLAVLQVLFSHMDSTELFSNVDSNQTRVSPVGTQPGWYIFYTSDEVFLLSPNNGDKTKPAFSTFSKGLGIDIPLLYPTAFVMTYAGSIPGSINAAVSAQIFSALAGISVIVNGRLAPGTTFSLVKMGLANLVLQKIITDDQVTYIYNVLTNSPILFINDFIGDGVSPANSILIYQTLQSFSVIDPNGRIPQENLTGQIVASTLANLILQGTITQAQVPGIYKKLVQAPQVITLTYTNQGEAKALTKTSDFHFDVSRLSTGAINKISRALFVNGVDALLSLKTQEIPVLPVLPFERFKPSLTNLNWPSALDATQVDFDGLYGKYFWEIFYHAPMLVSYCLNTNQQYQDAQTWLQYVFNPTVRETFVDAGVIVLETQQEISAQQSAVIITQLQTHNIGDPPLPVLSKETGEVNPNFSATTDLGFLKIADPTLTKEQVLMVRNILLNYQLNAPSGHYWQFRPFRNHTLQSLKDMLSDNNPAIKVYNDDPFDPFAIARLRIGAFEKSTLIQYIDNLIAWGDQLFTQDTWEAITAAYMLYVYAYDLLGPRPEQVGECPGDSITLTFNEIKDKYPDGIPQFLIDLEHFISGGTGSDIPMLGHAFNDLYVYFCVPENANLIGRWDTVEDRMYKINNSLNIQGIFSQLALFEPPINPLDLVKAGLSGNNVQANAFSKPQLSPYRYSSVIYAANTLGNTLISLGNGMLGVLEKNDAEGLAALQANQQSQILDLMTQIKLDKITELQATIQSLNENLTGANNRLTFYTDLINNGLSDYEQTSLSATEAALAFNILGSISKTAATIAYTIPQVGSPFAMTYGGIQVGSSLSAFASVFEIGSEISSYIAQRASTMGGYDRRSQDWGLQKQIAQADTNSITQQIAAGNLQLQSAQQDLVVHKKSIVQNLTIENYLKNKFTNQQLYQWMIGRLGAVYFQTYSLAIQLARQAEAAYQFETDTSQTFLSFDYWDNLHKGLTAGEGLTLALNRMDVAFRKGDTRRLEIEKSISLALIAPDQLLALKTTGKCSFSFPETLFDYDYPGQYARKIKTISVSVPVVLGPYQTIKAVLMQTKNSVVTDPSIDAVNYLLGLTTTKPATGLRENWATNQRIAISRGVDDSGLFVLDFQDPRYLPFENTGIVSDWTLSMPLETNRFDFEQISDIIISVKYSALYDGNLETNVKQSLSQAPLDGGVYVDGAMQNTAWFAFMSDHNDPAKQILTLTIDPAQVGFFKSVTYTDIILQLNVASGIKISDGAKFMTLTAGDQPAQTPVFNKGQAAINNLTWNGKTLSTSWQFTFALTDPQIGPLLTDGFIDGQKLLDMQVIVLYQAKVF